MYMSDEEFRNSNTVNAKEIGAINEELSSRGIETTESRMEFVRKNYGGHIYMYFMLKELDEKILNNYHNSPEKYTFSLSAVDGLLRAFIFSTEYIQEGIPEHAFNYIKSKSSSFINELEKQLRDI